MKKRSNSNNSVNIILINSNGYSDTIECLQSVFNSDYSDYRIIIVDNNSTDDSIKHLDVWLTTNRRKPIIISYNNNKFKTSKSEISLSPNCITDTVIIRSDSIRGFAENNNIGIKYSLNRCKPRYFWLLNNDTVIEHDSLLKMINVAESNEKFGIVGSRLVLFFNREIIQSLGNNNISWKGIGYGTYDGIRTDSILPPIIPMQSIIGASFLIKTEVIEKIGLMDESYFMTHEESDWCIRAINAGYKLFTATESTIFHKEGRSTDRKRIYKRFLWKKASRTSIVDFLIWGYYSFRNEIYFVKKHFKSRFIFYILFYLPKKYIVKAVAVIIFNDDHKLTRLYLLTRAIIDGIFSRMGKPIDVREWRTKFK